MATVYLAHDLKHDREVAVKVLRPDLAAVLGVDRFLSEIKVTANLQHPHILPLFDSGSADGFLYYVMPLVDGESLRDRLNREKQLSLEDALAITTQVAGALDYAHRQGVLHRDIKPENILLKEGQAILADFGIALAVKEAGGNRLTETGLSLGTPQYMSPEQATGDRSLDARSDVFSLGAVLYEMLAGEPPVTGPNAQAMIAKLMTERPIRLKVVRDTVPDGVDAAVARALSKVPADRFPSAAAFSDALNRSAADVSAAGRRGRRAVDVRRVAAVAAGVLGLGAIAVVVTRARRAPNSAHPAHFDRVQLTSSGHAYLPVISPDGSQVAYVYSDCDNNPSCTSTIMMRETASSAERPIVEKLTWAFPFQWSQDGLWLVFNGTGPGVLPAIYAVSRLGGPLSRLSDGVALLLPAGDTAITASANSGSRVYLRYLPPPWGQVSDSVPITSPDSEYGLSTVRPSPTGKWLALGWWNSMGTEGAVTIHDRSGRQVDRLPALGTNYLRWAPGGRAILLPLYRSKTGASVPGSLLRIAVDPGNGRLGRIDTLTIAPDVSSSAVFDFSADGRSLVYAATRDGESSVSTREARPGSQRVASRTVATSSRRMGALIAPDGRRLFYSQQTSAADSVLIQWFVTPFDSSTPRAVTPPLPRTVAVTTDGQRLFLLTASGPGHGAILASYDQSSGTRTTFAEVTDSESDVALGPSGGLALIRESGRVVRLVDKRGRELWRAVIPDSLGRVSDLLLSPDQSEFVAQTQPVSLKVGPDGNVEIVLFRMSAATGVVKGLVRLRVQQYWLLSWSPDGWLHLVMATAANQELRLYRLRPAGGSVQPEGALPPGSCQPSQDMKRWACVKTQSLSDIYLLRNFDKIH